MYGRTIFGGGTSGTFLSLHFFVLYKGGEKSSLPNTLLEVQRFVGTQFPGSMGLSQPVFIIDITQPWYYSYVNTKVAKEIRKRLKIREKNL